MHVSAMYDVYDGNQNGRMFPPPVLCAPGAHGYESEGQRSEQNKGIFLFQMPNITLVLLNPDMPYVYKQYRSISVGF